MAENLDLLLSILPFEKELFTGTPLKVAFVGHPLSERMKTLVYKTPPFPLDRKIVSLFPGSRKKEIERNLPLILDVCRDLQKKQPELRIALSVSDERFRPLILQIIKEKGWDGKEIELVPAEYSYELMKASYLAIAKSGTVTLELALHRVPTVVIYGVSFLDKIIAYDILRIRLPFYCLVNIIAQKEVFPELIGPNFTYENVKAKAEMLLGESARLNIQNACDDIISQLGGKETSKQAASEILKLALDHHPC